MKIFFYTIASLALIGALSIGTYYGMSFYKASHDNSAEAKASSATVQENKGKSAKTKSNSQTSNIGGTTTTDLGIDSDSTEEEVMSVMHKMTHQKVKAEEKWGAVLMSKANAAKIYNIVKNSDFDQKKEMLDIAARWKKGDYSTIVDDHNYFWGLQDGTIGKAYDTMSQQEEKTYVLNNFGKKITAQIEKSGEL